MLGLGLNIFTLAIRRYFGGGGGQFAGSSLNLDFTSGNQSLDPRITFSRASNATVTGPDGVLGYAPHNLLTHSEQFDASVWVKGTSSIEANTAVAPDGTTTADKLVEDTSANATHLAFQTFSAAASTAYVFSCYVKAAERSAFTMVNTKSGMSTVTSNFNLVNGTVISTTSADSKIEALSNGWYRVSQTLTTDAVAGTLNLFLYTNNDTTTVYTGDGTSGLFIWGAQLNVGPLQPYYPTTVKNLLGYTQEFDNAAWVKAGLTVSANATTAPDGSATADKLITGAGVAFSSTVLRTAAIPKTSAPAVHTATIYAKAEGFNRILLQVRDGATSANNAVVLFDVASGAIASPASAVGTFSGALAEPAEPVGSGWYRCGLTFTSGSEASLIFQVSARDSTASTGDGTSGIYIWGAQLSDSASLDPYVYNPAAAPAASEYYGPRFDYDPVTLQPKGLLIEEQRTNSIRNNTMVGAVAGTPGTVPTNWALSANSGMSVNVISTEKTQGIDTITLRFFGTPSINNTRLFFDSVLPVASDGQTWVGSAYCQLVSSSVGSFESVALRITGPSTTLDEVGVMVVPTEQIQRFERARTLAGGFSFAQAVIRFGFAVGVPIDITIRIGLPQLELGAFATSPIPTTTAAATRAADVAVMTGANFSNWYRQDEGTLFAEWSSLSTAIARAFTVNDATQNNTISLTHSGTAYGGDVYVSGAFQGVVGPSSSLVANAVVKHAIGVALNNANTTANGTNGTTDTAVLVPTVTQALIGAGRSGLFHSGYIRRISYFPRRLNNSELQGLTS